MRIKLFYKSDYKYMKSKCSELNGVIRELKGKLEIGESQYQELVEEKEDLMDKVDKLTFDFERSMELVDELRDKISANRKEIISLKTSKGGFTKKINQLTNELTAKDKEIEELETKLAESMTDKYAVKKVKSGRRPNTLKRSSARPVKGSVQKYQQKLERMEV